MKRKLVMLLTIVAVLAVGIGIWYNVPINLMDLEHDEVIEIVVFNGNTGNATHITDETQIEHIIENLNEIKLKRSKPSVGYSGYSFKMTIYLSDGNEADDWNNFIINSDDTIRKDPFFYKVVSEKIDYTVTVTDEKTGALTPEGNLSLVDDYHTSYSDGSGQQFITLVSKSGNTFYLVIDRNAKGENTVHFMNLVDESDLLSLMEDEDAEAYTAEKEAAAQAEQERKQAEEDAKKAEEEAAASGSEQPKENKITKYAATFLGVLALVGLAAGGGIYAFMKQKQKKKAEKEALDPDANYTEDKGDFEIPVEDEPEETGEEDNAEE